MCLLGVAFIPVWLMIPSSGCQHLHSDRFLFYAGMFVHAGADHAADTRRISLDFKVILKAVIYLAVLGVEWLTPPLSRQQTRGG